MECIIDKEGHIIGETSQSRFLSSLLLRYSCIVDINNGYIGLISTSGDRLIDTKFKSISFIRKASDNFDDDSSAFCFYNNENASSCSIVFRGERFFIFDNAISGYNDDFVWNDSRDSALILNYDNEILYKENFGFGRIVPNNENHCLIVIYESRCDIYDGCRRQLHMRIVFTNGKIKKIDIGNDYFGFKNLLVNGKIPLYKSDRHQMTCDFIGLDGILSPGNMQSHDNVIFSELFPESYITCDERFEKKLYRLFSMNGKELVNSYDEIRYRGNFLFVGWKVTTRQGKETQFEMPCSGVYPCYFEQKSRDELSDINELVIKNTAGKIVYINNQVKQCFLQSFDDARYFVNGYAAAKRLDKWGLINKKGEWVIQPSFSDISVVSDGLVSVKIDDKWGYSDLSGQVIIQCQYEDCFQFSNGLAAVKYEGLWGYIDAKGQIVIPFKYTAASIFENGYSIVDDGGEYHNVNLKHATDIECQPVTFSQKGHAEINLQNYANFAFAKKGDSAIAQTTVPIAKCEGATIDIRLKKEENNITFYLILKFYGINVSKAKFDISFKSTSNDMIYCFSENAESVYNDFSKNNIVRIEKQVELSIINKISSECKCLHICYEQSVLSCPVEDFSERLLFLQYALSPNDTDISNSTLLKKQIQKSMPNEVTVKVTPSDDKKKTNKGKTDNNINIVIQDCLNKLSKLDFDNMKVLLKFLSSPKSNAAYKNLANISEDFDPPHPLVKLLSKIPNKSKLLDDIKTVDENREFQANHRLISSVFKKKTELDPDTVKFINKIKQALK